MWQTKPKVISHEFVATSHSNRVRVRTWLLDSGKDGGNVLQLLLGLLHLPRGLLALDLRLVGLGQGLGRTIFVTEVSCFLIPEYLHL